ncbi:MAG TPA: lipoprotein insertase outer membrane protein LolB [Steroidobacteraceae bacterium]
MRKARLSLLVLCLAATVAGCVTARAPAAGGSTPDPQRLEQWTAKGRIGIAAQGEGGSGSFTWRQDASRTDLALRGPLGAGGMDLVTDGTRLELRDASGQALDGDAARTTLERRLGGPLPLNQLRYWMLGVPAPAGGGLASSPVQMATGAVPGFVQDGWVVTLDESRIVGAWRVPVRLSATTSGIRIKVVVDDWQLPP